METDINAQMMPTCDMERDCDQPVTMLDSNGYVYCTDHGIERRYWKNCRKLRPHELNRIARGQQIKSY